MEVTKYHNIKINWEYGKNYYDKRNIILNFQDKEEYLYWRKRWKEAYQKLSNEIRHSKRKRKQYIWARKNGKKIKIGKNPLYEGSIDYDTYKLSTSARFFLEARVLSKVKAEESYQRKRQAA